MRRLCLLLLCLTSLLSFCGCERYVVADEDSFFSISCSIPDGSTLKGAEMSLSVVNGVTVGDCYLNLSLKGETGSAVTSYRLFYNGRTSIGAGDAWTFDNDGEARFTISGLPAGRYTAVATVSRWRSSASADCDFEIK